MSTQNAIGAPLSGRYVFPVADAKLALRRVWAGRLSRRAPDVDSQQKIYDIAIARAKSEGALRGAWPVIRRRRSSAQHSAQRPASLGAERDDSNSHSATALCRLQPPNFFGDARAWARHRQGIADGALGLRFCQQRRAHHNAARWMGRRNPGNCGVFDYAGRVERKTPTSNARVPCTT